MPVADFIEVGEICLKLHLNKSATKSVRSGLQKENMLWNWVSGVYEKLRAVIDSESLHTRKFIYGNTLKLFWLSIVLALFAEYRLAKWLRPGFDLQQPLSPAAVLLMFGILVATVIISAELGIRMFTYWFPYFEIEGNISRRRLESRKVVLGVASTIYTAAIVNAIALVFGPTFGGWIGHH